jgi:hypothetical protein
MQLAGFDFLLTNVVLHIGLVQELNRACSQEGNGIHCSCREMRLKKAVRGSSG